MPPTARPRARWAAALALALVLAAAPPAWAADSARPKPKANNDRVEATAGTPLAVPDAALLANDTADDPSTLTVVAVDPPDRGTVSRAASGETTYTPPDGYTGKDEFRYTIEDGEGRTDTGKVRVDVVSAPPAFTSEPVRDATAGEPYRYDVTAEDPDGDPVGFQVAVLPDWLSVDNGAPGDGAIALVGEPDDDDVGDHDVLIRVTDGEQTVEQEFTITVRDDDAPVAADDTAETDAGESVVVAVLANDTGEDLRVVDVSDPAGGEAQAANGRRTVRYTPDDGFTGEDTFTYTVEDDDDRRATATVTVTVRDTNNPPTPTDDAATTPEGTAVTVDVLANDDDPDGDALTVTGVSQPTSGASTVASGGAAVRYTPGPGFTGTDTFTYTVADGDGAAASATVTVTVTEVTGPPTAEDDAYETVQDEALVVGAPGVLENDSDPDGDPLTAQLVTSVSNGTLDLRPDGSFTYTPSAGFLGTDAFTYQAADAARLSETATVTITVVPPNAPPVADDDAADVLSGQTVQIDVLDGDTDPDGDPLTVVAVTQPANGTAAIVAGGAAVRYTASAAFAGTDAFTYTVSDGNGGTDTGTVTVRVTRPPVAPTAGGDAYSTPEDAVLTAPPPGVLANDDDANGDALTALLETDVSDGTLALRADGSFTYTPDPDFNGTDTFTYRASDGALSSEPATVTITVTPVNDAPTAQPDVYSTPEDTPLVVGAADGVLENDTDPDDDDLTAVLVSDVSDGTLTLAADGSFAYTPDDDFDGQDAFTYRASDGALDSPPTTVTITVGGTNDPPVAVDDDPTTPEDRAVTVDVLANDTDADDDDLTVLSVTQPANGEVVRTEGGAEVRYTPDPDFNGTDTFRYTASDGNGGTATATVTVTVTPVNDPPVFTSEPDTTATENVRYAYVVTARDPDGDDLTFAAPVLPDWLSLTSGTGPDDDAVVLEGTPGPDDVGDAVVTLRVSDGAADTTQTFTITVEDVDDPPVARDDAAETAEDTAVTVDVLANDADPDGRALTITAVSAPANGTAAAVDRAVRYTPDPDFSGTDAFTYTVSDGARTATATVTVTVTPVDDVPVARPDVYVTAEDTPLVVEAPGVLANDVDPDSPLAAEAVAEPANGTLALAADG